MHGMTPRRNLSPKQIGQALVALRNAKLSPKRRSEIAKKASAARTAKLSPKRRSEIAKHAARARWAKKRLK